MDEGFLECLIKHIMKGFLRMDFIIRVENLFGQMAVHTTEVGLRGEWTELEFLSIQKVLACKEILSRINSLMTLF